MLCRFNAFIGGCGMNNKDNNREAQIKRSFNKMLSIYPTKTLKTFMIKRASEIKNLIRTIKERGLLALK